MKIHCIRTGTVVLKQALYSLTRPAGARALRILADPRLTPPLPICCWLIEHPEGLIMVDTGELARASDPSFFYEDRDYRRLIKVAHAAAFSTKPSDEVGPQLARLGINARTDVRRVILTHLHCDHADGLTYFPNADILVSRAEFAQTHYAFPRTWPIWFRPTLVDYTDGAFGAFAACRRVTDAGDVLLVPTPGHTFGHQSVMIRSGDRWVCLAGDATHTEGQLSAGEPTGGVADVKTARATLATLSRHRAQLPLLYLPSHDPASPDKLAAWS